MVNKPTNDFIRRLDVKEGETVNVGALLGSITKTKSTSTSSESD